MEEINKKIKYRYFLKGQKIMNKEHFSIGKVSESEKNLKFPDLENEEY